MLFLRQLGVLIWKNILIALVRHPVTTPLRCLVLPIVFGWFLSYARNFFVAPAVYGIGTPSPVRSLQDAYSAITDHSQLVFVHNNFTGGDIERVIGLVGDQARAGGKSVQVLPSEADLLTTCRSSLRGASDCLAGVVFHSSPSEGNRTAGWNYTLRADGSLGARGIKVNRNDNDQELFVLPLQHALDRAIAGLNASIDVAALPRVEAYPYTSLTPDELRTRIRVGYAQGLINILGVAFFVAICGVVYQQVGFQATERELGLSVLMECMMPNARRWQPQVLRLLSYHLAFTLLYLPGWVALSIILKVGVFARTSYGVVLGVHLLAGLALASSSLFVAAFFRKAQLSGITGILVSLLLAILAQVLKEASNGAVAVLSLLFPSMNYTWLVIYMARWEQSDQDTNIRQAAPNSTWTLSGAALLGLLAVQIIVYPILALLVERLLYGTAGGRRLTSNQAAAIEIQGFSKHFPPPWLRSLPVFRNGAKETVVATDNLDLTILQRQLTVLLGANGSGKSTTLDAIAGLSRPTHGSISVDFAKGLGLCPQKNVHWPLLTVAEHVHIFSRLKSQGASNTREERANLVRDCDLAKKSNALARTLSGGQMRKLQLAMCFIGGSGLCLVDECSSGVDPIARQKILSILLAERSRSNRTIVFTSHYLDESDIADKIVIMSKGKIRLNGTAPEIKQSGVYRLHLYHGQEPEKLPKFEGYERKEMYDQTVYTLPSAKDATDMLSKIEEMDSGIEYQISGPTIEDAFMQVAEEMVPDVEKTIAAKSAEEEKDSSVVVEEKMSEEFEKPVELESGSEIGPLQQGLVLFRKRATVFRRNPFPSVIAFLIAPIAAGLVSLFLVNFQVAGCSPGDQVSSFDVQSLGSQLQKNLDVALGPPNVTQGLGLVFRTLGLNNLTANGTGAAGLGGLAGLAQLAKIVHLQDTLPDFNGYIQQNFHNVTPGGAFLGPDTVTLAYKGNGLVANPFILQNIADMLLTRVPIAAQFQIFDIPWAPDQGQTLQFCVYFGLALSVYPAFFALYPTLERLRHVRGLHYSNGVRALPLWLSYAAFDFGIIVLGSALAVIVFRAVSDIFFGLGELFVVLLLYGLTSTLLGYVVSLFAKSQLAAFAIAAAYQAVTLLLYMIAYLSTFTYAPVNSIDKYILIVHYTLSIIFPSGSMMRALFVSINELSTNCRGPGVYVAFPGDISAYGGPILYLIVQSVVLFAFLVWWDSGATWNPLRRAAYRAPDKEERQPVEPEVAAETARVEAATDDGLRVLHLTKAFGATLAVEDVSFGVRRGEVFALLGPNGAGKSTTLGVVRGDLAPSGAGGDVLIEGVSVRRRRAAARQRLGVCPQFDAMDSLSVDEHLAFYARIRGVARVAENVDAAVRAVGLGAFRARMGAQLSGGNKRKLSLGIALLGNPGVVLLDEPSSGLDVAAKRVLWRTLDAVAARRSLVLTTHSMEEADRLCQRAAILARRMLTVGTSDELRRRHGRRYYVHVLLRSAPGTSLDEAAAARDWVRRTFDGAEMQGDVFYGQLRFSVPIGGGSAADHDAKRASTPAPDVDSIAAQPAPGTEPARQGGIAALFGALERSKEEVGFDDYSVSQTTLDQVFLSIVGQHQVREENYHEPSQGRRWWRWRGKSAAS